MNGPESNTVDSVAEKAEEASVKDVLPSLERWFSAWQLRWHQGKALLASDIRLSLKAVAVCAITALLMVAVTTGLWLAVNGTVVVALYQWQLHWALISLVILLLNAVLLKGLMNLFKSAYRTISLDTSISTLMADSAQPSETKPEEQ
ncbi:hypothetical protein [Neptunicella sp. SCSIO 80796]|uniref:hypothetical protein n=1 Tax=Neptunicella plasticusilytica TaxID=3117012 RepID=UPI003A4D3810